MLAVLPIQPGLMIRTELHVSRGGGQTRTRKQLNENQKAHS